MPSDRNASPAARSISTSESRSSWRAARMLMRRGCQSPGLAGLAGSVGSLGSVKQPATAASVGVVAPETVELEPFELECGETLPELRIAYEAYGELDDDRANVILVFHAISGDAHAAGQ